MPITTNQQLAKKAKKPVVKLHDLIKPHVNRIKTVMRRLGALRIVHSDRMKKYFDTKDSKDVKTAKVEAESDEKQVKLLTEELALGRAAVRSLIGKKPVKTVLGFRYNVSSSVSTQLAVAHSLTPSEGNEWSSFQAIFDEYRVIGVHVLYNFLFTTEPGNAQFNGVAYDELEAAAVTTIDELSEVTQHQINNCGSSSTASNGIMTESVTPSGLREFNLRVPAGVAESFSTGSGVAFAGGWQLTTGSSQLPYGYLKIICETPSTGGIASFVSCLRYMVEFRNRA